LVAPEYVAESLVEALLERAGGTLGRVLLARAKVARDVVPERLRAAGAQVDVVAAYETHSVSGADAERLAHLVETDVDVVLLTSSSMVSSLVDALGARAVELLNERTIACIGPI